MKKNNYILVSLILVILILSFLILKDYLSALLSALVLSFMFSPLNKFLCKKLKNKTISAFLTILIVFLVFLIPLLFIVNIVLQQSLAMYAYLNQINLDQFLIYFSSNESVSYYVYTILQELPGYLVNVLSGFILSLPGRILQFFIMLFATFYFLRDSDKLIASLKKFLPMGNKYKSLFINKFRGVTHGIVFGVFVSGLIQGLVGTVGLLVFGVPNALLWGLVLTLLAILPFVGAFLVWVPASLYLYFSGEMVSGILLFLYGLVIVSLVDNIIKPTLVGAKAKIHPLIILIGFFGGVSLFGIVGIVLGPLILAYLVLLFKIINFENVLKK